MEEWVRRFGASLPMRMTASWFRVLGPTEYKVAARLKIAPEGGLPSDRHRDRISVPSKLSRYGPARKVWPGKEEACRKVGVTANLVDISDAQVGTKKTGFEIEPRNPTRKASPPWRTP
jgi:hypothetical protein